MITLLDGENRIDRILEYMFDMMLPEALDSTHAFHANMLYNFRAFGKSPSRNRPAGYLAWNVTSSNTGRHTMQKTST